MPERMEHACSLRTALRTPEPTLDSACLVRGTVMSAQVASVLLAPPTTRRMAKEHAIGTAQPLSLDAIHVPTDLPRLVTDAGPASWTEPTEIMDAGLSAESMNG